MSGRVQPSSRWWARGLLFENCSCGPVCPGHLRLGEGCELDRCVGYRAVAFREGDFEGVPLAGVSAVLAFDCPQFLSSGPWTEALVIDLGASPLQRRAAEEILTGRAGGPWAVTSRFVSRRLPTRYLPIRIEDRERVKHVSIEGLLDSTIEAIRGRDRTKTVTFENLFNQVHAATQVIARGATRYDDGTIAVHTDKSHALYSQFHWTGSNGAEPR